MTQDSNSHSKGEPKAVLLLSGGLDSSTVLAIAKDQGYKVHALSFHYGQRHSVELDAVKKIVERNTVEEFKIIPIDLRAFGGSALTDDIAVPKQDHFKGVTEGVPITYVPARNTIFLSFALAYAETIGAFDIFIGANIIDYSNYPDCRPEYLESFEKMANLATKAGMTTGKSFKIHAPLLSMSKAEIIQTGMKLGVDYSITLSCYDPSDKGLACGRCDTCHLRLKGFQENGMTDPAPYET